MKLVELLKSARSTVLRGWAREAEHHGACTTFSGEQCDAFDEGVWEFSVRGAIACTANERSPLNAPQTDAAWRALERIACPMFVALEERDDPPFDKMTPDQVRESLTAMRLSTDGPLLAWLEVPSRTLADVIGVFDRAIQRAQFLAENRR